MWLLHIASASCITRQSAPYLLLLPFPAKTVETKSKFKTRAGFIGPRKPGSETLGTWSFHLACQEKTPIPNLN